MKSAGITGLGLALSLTLSSCIEQAEAPPRNITPTPAPEFSLKAAKGGTVSSKDLKGQIVVINFWASWNPGSSKEIPDLIDLNNKFKGKVTFIGIALGEETGKDVETISTQLGINYPVGIASEEFHQKFGGIDAIPSSFVIDKDWNLVNRYTGRIQPEMLTEELKYMLSEKKK